MAQVRKYSTGGSAKKYGTFTIDNTTYQVDDDFINQLSSYASTLDSGRGEQFKYIIDAVKSGKDLVYNSAGNGELIGDVNFNLTDKQKKRMEKGRTNSGTFFGSLWGGKEQQARLAVSALKDFRYNKPTTTQRWDWSRAYDAEYEKDSDGNYVLTDNKKRYINGANNQRIVDRLDHLGDIAGYGDDVEFVGYGDLAKDAYVKFHKSLMELENPNDPNDKRTKLDALKQRILDGTWTNADAEMINDIGVFLDPEYKKSTTDSTKKTSTKSGADKAWEDSGLKRDVWSSFINFDDDGNAYATSDFRTKLFNGAIKGNAFFNDDWDNYRIRLGYNDDEYSWLKGKALIGNRFYNISDLENPDSFLYKWAHSNNGFYDLNNAGRFDEADALAEYRWDNERKYLEYDPEAHYSPYMESQDKSRRYRSLSKLYDNLPENHQLIGYYDDTSERDLYGRPIESYVVLDPSKATHDVIDYTINPELLKYGIDDSQLWGELITDNEDYKGMYGTDLGGDWKYYVDPREDRGIVSIPGEFGGKNIRVPSELVAAIRTNPDFWSKLLSDKTLIDRFTKSLREGVDTGFGEDLRDFFKSLKVRDYEELGFDPETSKSLFNAIDKGWGNRHGKSKAERQRERLVPKYQVESHQKGGALFKAIGNKEEVENVKDTKKVGTTSDALSLDKANLSQADKLELASLIGELGSFGLSLTGAGSLAAGAVGGGATIAQFIADAKRDGLDLGDIGNLAFGLGLDAVTLIPGAGIAAKAAKISKRLKKSKAVFETLLYSWGAKDAIVSLTNIVNGDGTINDFRNLGNALMIGRGVSNEYKRIKNTSYKPNPKKTSKTESDYKKEAVDEWLKDNPKNKLLDANNPDSYAEWVNKQSHDVEDYEKAFEGLSTIEEFNKKWNSKKSKMSRAANKAGNKALTATGNLFSSKWNPFSENYFLMSREFPSDFVRPDNMPYWMREQVGFWDKQSFKKGGQIHIMKKGDKTNSSGGRQLDFSGIIKPDAILGMIDYYTSKSAIEDAVNSQKEGIRAGMYGSQRSMPTEVYSQFTDGGLRQAGEARKRNIRISKPVTSDADQYLANQLMREQHADAIDAETNAKIADLRSRYNQQVTSERQKYAGMRDEIAFNNRKDWATGEANLHMADANKAMQDAQNKKQLLYQLRQDHAKDLLARQSVEEKLRLANAETAYLNDLSALFESKGGFDAMSEDERKNYQSDWRSFIEDKFAKEASEIRNKHQFNSLQEPINNRMYQHSWIPWYGDLSISPISLQTPNEPTVNTGYHKKGGKVNRIRNVDEARYLDQHKAIDKAVAKLNDNIVKLFIKMMS